MIDRIFAFCQEASEDECTEFKASFVAGMVQAHRGEATVTRELLTLVVRSDAFCREVRDYYARQNRQAFIQQLAPGLCTLMMADLPNMSMVIHNEDMAPLDLAPDAATQIARTQTLAEMPRVDEVVDISEHPVTLSGYPNMTSLLLDSAAWTRLAAREDFVIAVPEDSYIIIERRDRVTPAFRADVAGRMRAAQRGVSAQLYRWENGRWVVVP